jgi:aminopeptidase
MLTDTQLDRYADVLFWALKTARKKKFKKGDMILVRYHLAALPLAERLFSRILEAGMHPIHRLVLTAKMEKDFYTLSDNKQLTFHPPGSEALFEGLNGSIYLYGPDAITHLSNVDPVRIGKVATAYKKLKKILDARDEAGDFGWTLCMVPTLEPANQAEIDLKAYTQQIVKACFLDKKDPVAKWQEVLQKAGDLKKWLNALPVEKLHVESEHVDLTVKPGERRRWIGISGHNIPSFEIFLSPDWRGTQGVYYANLPSYRSGNRVEGVRLEFEKGRVVKVSAQKGEAFVSQQIAMDPGASRVGEFSLTDKRFSKIDRFMANTLFDENFGGSWGNCHVALGSSYTDTFDGDPGTLTQKEKQRLGFNDSALHWDLVNTENKRVIAHLKGGERLTIYENGQFAY